jgi:hypothetical protein
VLKHGERVVDYLTDRLVSEDTDNSTHRPSLPRAFRNCARVLLFYVVWQKIFLQATICAMSLRAKGELVFGRKYAGIVRCLSKIHRR